MIIAGVWDKMTHKFVPLGVYSDNVKAWEALDEIKNKLLRRFEPMTMNVPEDQLDEDELKAVMHR